MSNDSHHHHHHHHHHHERPETAKEDKEELAEPQSKRIKIQDDTHTNNGVSEKEEQKEEKREKEEIGSKDPIVGWTSLFTHTKAGEICHRKLFTVKTTDTVAHLLKVLSDHNILSCPVLHPETNEFVGFVDTLDVAGFVLSQWKKHSKELEHGKFPAKEFFQSHVQKLLNYSKVDPAVAVDEDVSMLGLIDVFTDPNNFYRLHRVAVVDKDKNMVGIISQSDLIAFAYKNISFLPREFAEKKLSELKIGRSLIFVRLDSSFIDTLDTMYQNRISGLALVDEEFRLSGNISVSDLRGMSPNSFDYFLGSTLQFLVKGRKGPIKPPTSVPMESTIETVLKTLHENKIHRVYVTNVYDRPQYVISLGDIIARLI